MFDARTLARLERVIDLQMWAFGCDARHPSGNLFARRGMKCRPPPSGEARSSVWCECDGPCVVELCSTGITFTRDDNTLCVQRGALQSQLREQPVELLRELARWILRWEAWVDEVAGVTWRDEALASRTRPARWSARGLRDEWAAFSTAVQQVAAP